MFSLEFPWQFAYLRWLYSDRKHSLSTGSMPGYLSACNRAKLKQAHAGLTRAWVNIAQARFDEFEQEQYDAMRLIREVLGADTNQLPPDGAPDHREARRRKKMEA